MMDLAHKFLQYIVNKCQCNFFTVSSFFNSIFSGNNNTMYRKNNIGNKMFISNY